MQKSLFSLLIIFIFSFQYTFAADYYWVGGNGNWTDYSSHWAKTSGGNVFHTQVPGPLDNIYFDNSSLSGRTIVNLDQTIESCKDISVSITTDSLIFNSTAASPKLSIYGSTLLSPRLKVSGSIRFYFEASSGSQTFNQNRAILPCSLYFNNSGNWQILDSMNVFAVEIIDGTFNASNKKIRAGYFTKTAAGASVNITDCDFYTYSLKITKSTDVVSGINISAISGGTYYNNDDHKIVLEGTTFLIDSIFSNKNFSITLNTNAHVKYIRINNTKNFSFSGSTTIDRIDVTDLTTLVIGGYPFVGIFNVSNLKNFYIGSGIIDITQLNLASNNDCNNLLQITGNLYDAPHKLHIHNNTDVILNYCSINNIDASAFPLKISNAVDGGNNTGVSFLSYAGQGTLYRIGDGAWSDITKWSFTSNGPPANCEPTIYTDVVFDAFSFTKPLNDVSFGSSMNPGVCKNLTVTNLTAGLTFSGKLNCYGDLISSSELMYGGNTEVYMCATGGTNKIKLTNGSGKSVGLELNIIGTATYNFLSDIVCGIFRGRNAQIYTNGFNMDVAYETQLISGHFYGSTSSISTSGFYNELGSGNDLESTRITCGSFVNSQIKAPVIYGTVILIGSEINGNFYSTRIKHLKITGSAGLVYNNSITCDTISIHKGILLNLYQSKLTFNVFYNPGNMPACGRYTHIKLSNSIFKSERDITFDQFILENIDASVSSFTYQATNSINANNTGILFSQYPTGKTFYWINGAGNWSDETHWSYTSGGPSANCFPSRIDNVIFDASSGITGAGTVIAIDVFFECNNFTLTNTSKVNFTGYLNVYGSFVADSDARFPSINLLGNTSGIVDSKKAFFESITINKTKPTTFVSNIHANTIKTVSGSLRLIDVKVDAAIFNAEFNNTDSLLMRNSKIHSSINFDLNCRNGLSDCSSGSIEISVKMNSYFIFRVISDSIPIHLNKIIMKYDTLDPMRRSPSDGIVLLLSNTNLDSLKLESSLEAITDLQMYNTKIKTLQAYNNELRLWKVDMFDYSAQPQRIAAQPANQNNILNAQLGSYIIGIANIPFDHLKIYPGSTLQIYPEDTLYINKTLDVTGAPSYPIQISSSMNGFQGYIQNNGAVFGEYLFIQDNHVLNNPGFPGYYSSDITNNVGWDFGVLYDTLLCTFNRTPCENEAIQLTVISDQTLTNTVWNGPHGFTSATTSPILSNLSVANNGIYTFTSTEGTCMVDISVFKNKPNKIIDDLNFTGVVSVEDYTSTPIWYYNNSIMEYETGSSITPGQTGYYKAATTSNRGCIYMSDSIYYLSPLDPVFQPVLTSIETTPSNDVIITWSDVEREIGYHVYTTTPYNPAFNIQSFENADVVSAIYYSMFPSGDYCYYVKAVAASGAESLPSNTLCINLPDLNDGTITVKPHITYIGLNTTNDVEIRWNDVNGEVDYTIYNQTPNQAFYSIAGNAELNATTFILPNTGIGQYCVFLQANLISETDLSLPSDPVCIDVADPISTGNRNTKISTGTVYPNPTNTGAITISPASKNTLYSISIETLQGEKVFSKENQIGITQVTINLKQGVYLVKMQSDSFTYCEKLIVTQ